MSKRNIFYGLLIILAICIYYYYSPSDERQDKLGLDVSQSPTYQSKSMLTIVYDPSGEMIYKIVAEQVSHYADNGDTLFTSPNVTLYDRDKSASWNLQADNARLTKERMLYLTGNVKLLNLAPNAQLERITTQSAQIDLVTQIVTSDEQVTIQGPGFYSTGTKLNGNLREKTAHLLENVKTFYDNNSF